VSEPDPEGAWLLKGAPRGGKLLRPVRFESSTVPGFALRPATPPELRRWFETLGAGLRDGDTLLLYVTDHGQRAPRDVMETRIVLWGDKASVSVRELRGLLRTLPRGVRVVTLMSQCFSGGFAWLGHRDGERVPEPNVCGYFSSRYDLEAYGCYSALSGHDDVGHSFAFMRALEASGSFDDAHRAALVTDGTPDVPLRTSDLWLQELLYDQAAFSHVNVFSLIDTLLAEAWKNRAAWEPELRQLDRIGQAYGFASPRSVHEMQVMAGQLARVLSQVKTHAQAWSAAAADATEANLDDFVAATPAWAPWLDKTRPRAMTTPERRARVAELLPQLSAFTARGDGAGTLRTFSDQAETAHELMLRTKVRVAALLRMSALLSSIAGRVYLSALAEPPLLDAYRSMRACEGLTLPDLGDPGAAALTDEALTAMRPIVEDLRVLDTLAPAWTGFKPGPLGTGQATAQSLPRGAALVRNVTAGSPAAAAGMRVGDVMLGPPGKPFTHQQDLGLWSMLLKPETPALMAVRRRGQTFTATITPSARVTAWPTLAAPRLGLAAPEVAGVLYRGEQRPQGRRILFFWSTWCKPCKAALPELLALAKREDTPIIAITDEGRAQLDPFFAHWKAPFPAIVISDEPRRSMAEYGVSGTPTFVLIDDAGLVRNYKVGYTHAEGLSLSSGR
jgi:thiol-disulfide isomerase/thioredoxin